MRGEPDQHVVGWPDGHGLFSGESALRRSKLLSASAAYFSGPEPSRTERCCNFGMAEGASRSSPAEDRDFYSGEGSDGAGESVSARGRCDFDQGHFEGADWGSAGTAFGRLGIWQTDRMS